MENIMLTELEFIEDNTILRNMRKKIKKYYDIKKAIEILDKKIEAYYKRKESLEKDLHNSNVELDINISGVNYAGSKSNINGFESYIEKNLMQKISTIENAIKQVNVNIMQSEEKRMLMLDSILNLDIAISLLKKDLQSILYFKYYKKMTNIEISLKVYISESTVRKYINKALSDLYKWENIR